MTSELLQKQFEFIKIKQFASPDLPGSEINMDSVFLCKINSLARSIPGGLNITSGYRTAEYNKKISGVKNSAHLKGLAADITCVDNHKRYLIIWAALQRGFFRIGIGKTFVHLDMDRKLPSDIIFLY